MDMPFGSWMKVRRRQLDITQAELAERASCSLVTIRKIEQNDRRPSKSLAEAMATALAIPTDQITDFVTFARRSPDGMVVPPGLHTLASPDTPLPHTVQSASAQTMREEADATGTTYRLPRPTTPFIGREAEIATVTHFVRDPAVPLVSILGPGGMGKTRLALAVADRLAQSNEHPFVDGIVFVSLASLNEIAQMVPTLAQSLAISIDPRREARQQLLTFLASKQMLLILDNCEHLLDGVDLFQEIVQAAPQVCILATTRERLHVPGEQAFPIEGLGSLEESQRTPDELLSHPAVQLLHMSARRAEPTFALQAEELPHAVRICHSVAAMPLGIEIAAGWVGMMSLAAIADEIQDNLDFLESDQRTIPDRHRSIRAVFDASWRHLDREEQTIFHRLSIFRGGFSRDAAAFVAGASLRQLGQLIYKSLLHFDRDRDRYGLHELLRQYAREKLAEDRAEESIALEHHQSYYLRLLIDRHDALRGTEQEGTLAEIDAEIDNIRLAWRSAVAQPNATQLRAAMDSLGFYYQWRTRPEEGVEAFQLIRNEINANASHASRIAVIRALAWQAAFHSQQGRADAANELLEEAMALSHSPDIDQAVWETEQAFIYYQWGYCLERRQNERSLVCFRKSIELWEGIGDAWWVALGLGGLGFNLSWSNRFLEAREYLQKSIELFERYGNARELVTLHERMSDSCQFKGDLDAARYHGQRALTLAEGTGNRKALADVLRRMSTVILFTEGNLKKADELNNKALTIYQSLNTKIEYAIALAQRAKHLLARGHVRAAQHDFDAARSIFNTQQLRQGEGYSLRWLAIVAQMNGRRTDALEMINTSIDIFDEVGSYNFIPHLNVIRFLIDKENQLPWEARTQLAEIVDRALESREYFDILWSLPAIAWCWLQEESPADDGPIPQCIILAAEISGFMRTVFEYGQSAYMRSLVHDEVDALLAPWPQAEIAAAQARGQETDVWEIAETVWEFIQTGTTDV